MGFRDKLSGIFQKKKKGEGKSKEKGAESSGDEVDQSTQRKDKGKSKSEDPTGPRSDQAPATTLPVTTPNNPEATTEPTRGLTGLQRVVTDPKIDKSKGATDQNVSTSSNNAATKSQSATQDKPFEVDIVALHGLNGNLWDTWVHDDGTRWLSEMLPACLPGARIWTYGYPANVSEGTQHSTLSEHARRLLMALITHTQDKPRPIIFVCHSLGGIVAKQAFVDAIFFAEELLPRLKGIIFLATPHRGSDKANLGASLSKLVNVATRMSSLGIAKSPLQRRMLEILSLHSEYLDELHEKFVQRASESPRLEVTSFTESSDTIVGGKSFGIIVDKTSAVTGLPQDKSRPTLRSHTTICRFTKNEHQEELWPEVKRRLEEMARSALNVAPPADSGGAKSKVPKKPRIADLRKSLVFPGMHQREDRVDLNANRAHKDTFDWVLSNDDHNLQYHDEDIAEMKGRFRKWIHGDQAVFWVRGKAGSGKSTLMLKIYHDGRLRDHLKQWAPLENIRLARMFFDAEGTEMQKSTEGLLRSLLYQATEDEHLAMHILEPYLDKVPEDHPCDTDKIQWTVSELSNAFSALIGEASDTRRFLFFIDGLDEYQSIPTDDKRPSEYHLRNDTEQARQIRAGYRSIARLIQSFPVNGFVKICVSSRPYNEFELSFSGYPNFKLEDLTKEDIEEFVQSEVANVADAEAAAEYDDFVKDIRMKASGVFLWVKIATDILVDGIVNGNDAGELKSSLHTLPSELGGPDGLFMRILQRLGPDEKAEARKIFDLVLSARRDFEALSLSFAAEAHPQHAVALQIKALSDLALEKRRDKISKRLKALGGLLEIEGNGLWSRVRFLHLTVREFWLQADVQQSLIAALPLPELDVNVVLLAGCLLQLKCLKILEGPESNEYSRIRMRFWENIKDGLYYAALAERSTSVAQTALLDSMDETARHLYNEYYDSTDHDDFPLLIQRRPTSSLHHWADTEPQEMGGKDYTWKDDFMSLAVQANLTLYLRDKFRQGYRLSEKQGRPLFAYAIIPTMSPNLIQYQEGPGADTLGVNFSDVSMIKLLLDHGADPNASYEPSKIERLDHLPSIWQLALQKSEHCRLHDPKTPNLEDWLGTMKLLVSYGAWPNATIGSRKSYSALFHCLVTCIEYLDCDISLPKLLISKGARLRDGELAKLIEHVHQDASEFAALQDCFPNELNLPSEDP